MNSSRGVDGLVLKMFSVYGLKHQFRKNFDAVEAVHLKYFFETLKVTQLPSNDTQNNREKNGVKRVGFFVVGI